MSAKSKSVAPSVDGLSPRYKWLALSCTSLGMLMAAMNGGTLIIALPVLMKELHIDLLSVVWVLLAYMVVQTVLVVTAGRISDLLGRKKFYVLGFALFGVAALFGGFCTNAWELIVIRAVQGAAGAFMMANSSAMVTDTFPKKQLGLALGTNMIVIAVGSILGTIVGGWLSELGWQWVFWFNVPVSVVGTVWAAINLKELSTPAESKGHDLAGSLTYVVGITGLLIALSTGGIMGWTHPLVLAGGVAAVVAIPLFFVAERKAKAPMMDFSLFTHRGFSVGNLSTFLNSMARNGVSFLLVFYFQGPLGYDAITAGLLLAPIAISMLVVSPFSGILADRFGSRAFGTIGLALSSVGLIAMSFIGKDSAFWYVSLAMVGLGLGSGFFTSPNTRLIMTSVQAHQRGIASGMRGMFINSGGVVSITLVLAIVTSAVDPKDLFAIFAGVTTGLPESASKSFYGGLDHAFWVLTAISLVALAVSLIPHDEEKLSKPRVTKASQPESLKASESA